MTRPPVALPESYAALSRALAERPDAIIVGGGTVAVPTLSAGLAHDVISVLLLPPLALPALREGMHQLSAATRLAEIALDVRLPAALRTAAASVGGPAVRNRGTIGGNLCNAAGPGCLKVVALALEADVDLVGACGRIGWHRLTGPLPRRQVVVGIRWPADRFRRTAFFKIRGNGAGGAVSASVAVSAVERAEDTFRIAVGGGHLLAQRAPHAEAVVNGARGPISRAAIQAAGLAVAECVNFPDLGLRRYVRHCLAVACEDALWSVR